MSKLKQHFRVPDSTMDGENGRANRNDSYRKFLDRIDQAITEENRNIKLDPLDGYMRIATYVHIALGGFEDAYWYISDTDILCLKKAGYDPYKAARLSTQIQMLAWAENNNLTGLHKDIVDKNPHDYRQGVVIKTEHAKQVYDALIDMLENIETVSFADETKDKMFCPYNKEIREDINHHSEITNHFNDNTWFVATPEANDFRKNINAMFPRRSQGGFSSPKIGL